MKSQAFHGEVWINAHEAVMEAMKAFESAASAGFPPAMENIAACYQKGDGVKADEKKAMLWRIRSKAARGDRAARAWLLQNDKEKW